jgi:hypothetical protein
MGICVSKDATASDEVRERNADSNGVELKESNPNEPVEKIPPDLIEKTDGDGAEEAGHTDNVRVSTVRAPKRVSSCRLHTDISGHFRQSCLDLLNFS